MKTTLEIDEGLLKRAESVAQARGIPLSELMDRALACELESLEAPPGFVGPGERVQFPIFTSKSPGTLDLTNEDIRRLEEENDLRMFDRWRWRSF